MVNTMGLNKIDILSALGDAAQCVWEPVRPYKQSWKPIPNCWCTMIDEVFVMVDLRADDGFDETSYDKARGRGAAQQAINRLRMGVDQHPKYPPSDSYGKLNCRIMWGEEQ